jgi:hypothetical protein
VAETFPHDSLHAIAGYRVVHRLAGQRHTKTGITAVVARGKQRYPAVTQPVASVFEYPLVSVRFSEPYPPWETRRAGAQGRKSHGQTVTTLGATSIDYATAILGTHAGPKTMGPLALQITGLISSFHGTLRF